MAEQQQSSAMLEGIELTAENVEAAVLQFYRSGATQVILSNRLELLHTILGDAQVVDPCPTVASSMVVLLATYCSGQTT